MKTCCTCKEQKPLDSFYNLHSEKDGKARRCAKCYTIYHKSRYVPKGRVRKIPKERKCSLCQNIFPNTTEYFFTKNSTWTKADGTKCSKRVFRSKCKKCHGIKGLENQRKKMYKFYNCTEADYEKYYRKAMVDNKSNLLKKRYPFLYELDLTKLQIIYIIKTIRGGYKWIDYDTWLVDCYKRRHNAKAIHDDLPDGYYRFNEVPKELMNLIKSQREPNNSVIANRMRMKLHEVPEGVFDVKRIIHKINREIKNQ